MPLQIKNQHLLSDYSKAVNYVDIVGFRIPLFAGLTTDEYVGFQKILAQRDDGDLNEFEFIDALFALVTQSRSPNDSITIEELRKTPFTTDERLEMTNAITKIFSPEQQGVDEGNAPVAPASPRAKRKSKTTS